MRGFPGTRFRRYANGEEEFPDLQESVPATPLGGPISGDFLGRKEREKDISRDPNGQSLTAHRG